VPGAFFYKEAIMKDSIKILSYVMRTYNRDEILAMLFAQIKDADKLKLAIILTKYFDIMGSNNEEKN